MDWVFFSPLACSFPSFPQKKQRQEMLPRQAFLFHFFCLLREISHGCSLVRQRKKKAIILNTAREYRFSQFLAFESSLSLSLSLCVCAFIICARNRRSDCAFKTTYSLAEFVCLLLVHQEKEYSKNKKWRRRKLRSRTRKISPLAPPVVFSKLGIQSTFCFRSHVLFRPFVCVLIDHCCCCC